jgi:pilus assembly protein FimV
MTGGLADDAPDDDTDDDAHENLFAGDHGSSSLSEQDEAELREELAEVEREVAETRKARDGKSVLAAHRSAESSVTRILRETESQLDDTAASRRRATIAHLKAAVAATRADRDEGDEDSAPDGDEDLDLYRDDLDRVVRPRRPSDGRTVSAPRRLAPLMLVSEQRIDLPKGDAGADVRPRRITAGNLALLDEDDNEVLFDDEDDDVEETGPIEVSVAFAEYAARVGATDLVEVLEAAAAYSAFVEGRPSFTRPALMKQVAGYRFTREEGLRAFGTLLRQGKIQKLKRGQFSITRASRFRPDNPDL